MTRAQQGWTAAAAALALAVVLLAVPRAFDPLTPGLDWLLLALGLLPAAVLLGSLLPVARLPVGGLLVAGGVWPVVSGARGLAAIERFDVRMAGNDVRSLVALLAPAVQLAVGLALLCAGLALLARSRGALRVAAVLGGLCAVWTVGEVLMWPLSAVDDLGWGVIDVRVWLTALLHLAAGVLLLALAAFAPLAPVGTAPTDRPRRRPSRRSLLLAGGAAVVLALVLAVSWWRQSAPRVVVAETFPDPALAGCVSTALGQGGIADPDAEVSAADLGAITSLTCSGFGPVADLTGIDRLDGLVSLDLTGGQVSDLAPLAEVSGLADLRLAENRISDLTPLAELDLINVDLRDNPVGDLTGLEGQDHLSTLDLSQDAVTDLSPLRGLPLLSTLTLTNNRVTDLSPLAGLPYLSDLGLSGNAVVDLTPLAEVPTIRFLGLGNNRVTDVTSLAALTGLERLDLTANQVGDLAPLGGLQYLDELRLSDNVVTDLGPLSSAPVLRVVYADGNRISDLTGLAGAPDLRELWLGRNPLTDVTPLLQVPMLTGVDLQGLPSDLPGVAELQAAGIYVGGFAR
ncbi:leucine-rich repeat domain-containing protein [Modestobacter sp. SYSU DS0290]